jgi:hypothetical protein
MAPVMNNNRSTRRRHLHPQGGIARFTAIGKKGEVIYQVEVPLSKTVARARANRSKRWKQLEQDQATSQSDSVLGLQP